MRVKCLFVSSVTDSMAEERKALFEAQAAWLRYTLYVAERNLGHERVATEIKRHLAISDVFLLLLGADYGSTGPRGGESWTETEFRLAQRRARWWRRPAILVFQRAEPIADERQRGFVERVTRGASAFKCAVFETPKQLLEQLQARLLALATDNELRLRRLVSQILLAGGGLGIAAAFAFLWLQANPAAIASGDALAAFGLAVAGFAGFFGWQYLRS